MPTFIVTDRRKFLRQLAIGMSLLLMIKMLVSIVLPYRYYFPADFSNSAFLGGRQLYFG